MIEAAELMDRYLMVADTFKHGFQIEVLLIASHLFQFPVASYQHKSCTEFADIVEMGILVNYR